eukprot:m.173821 g.173821  ORF g.173821 m.173821 type:complete len:90 (+) comp16534_c0_seq2:2668-2937(+)
MRILEDETLFYSYCCCCSACNSETHNNMFLVPLSSWQHLTRDHTFISQPHQLYGLINNPHQSSITKLLNRTRWQFERDTLNAFKQFVRV